MRVLVCGSRTFQDRDQLARELTYLQYPKFYETGERGETPESLFIITGGAKGADTLAEEYAIKHNLGLHVECADWDTYGKSAGVIRNNHMLKLEPDLVVAFWDGKSRGTKNMTEQAEKAGVPVKIVHI